MAFNFLGTFDRSEVETLLEFAESQLEDVPARINYLRSLIERNGWVTFERDEEGRAISYDVRPENSTLSKYIRTYQFYGGSMLDLQIRSRGEWLSYTKGTSEIDGQIQYQGGRIDGDTQGDYYAPNMHKRDSVEAITVSKVKKWIIPSIKMKREEWEFKIKKSIDLVDQYLEEIILLVQRSTGAETLEDLKANIEFYLESDEFVGAGKGYEDRNR